MITATIKNLFPLGLRIVLLMLILGLFPPAGLGADPAISESQIKAVYLYNFLHFITWPDNCGSPSNEIPTTISVLGSSPVGQALDELAATITQDKKLPITIRHYQSPSDIKNCQILFLGPTTAPHVRAISGKIKTPLLTVADTENFLVDGGMINLVRFQGKIRYTINREAAESVGIQLNSQLLKTALKVIDNSENQPEE